MDMTMCAGSASLPINVAEGVPAVLAQLPIVVCVFGNCGLENLLL